MIIAIDGPAASGKGTIGLALANELGYAHIDSGLFYRLYPSVIDNIKNEDLLLTAKSLVEIFKSIDLSTLKGEDRAKMAAAFAADSDVREIVGEAIKLCATEAQSTLGGVVVDGRDIGTIIFPNADAKLFVTASVAARAGRRFAEMRGRGEMVTLDEIIADLAARDARDSQRAVAPLKPADDALLLDTSDLTIGQAVQRAIALVDGRAKGGSAA